MMRRRAFLGVLVAAAFAARAASVAEVAQYEGAGRQHRLEDGARKEGSALNIYTSLTVDDMGALNTAFEARYGIRIRMWRASSEKVLQRVLAEARAGRHDVDIIETNSPPLESLHREGLLQAVRSPVQDDLIAQALPSHREWAGSRLNVFVQAYNTNAVRKQDLPKSYADLADPKWKGKLGVEASDEDWFASVVTALGEPRGVELFRRIVAANGVSVRKGHTLLTNLVASGEVPLALTVYNFTAEQTRRKGAPFDWFVIPPAVARANGLALAKHAQHPHAALLYYDFVLGEDGQRMLLERGFQPANRNLQGPLPIESLRVVDPDQVLDESRKWTKLYESVFEKPH
ncbi:MAG TPA: extracellular solute-binding protein [Usitatibacter sp.]|nr:extracellular solute-binding protein [Usitatibacter sp.]